MKRLLKNRITVIAGHFGCGKTNIAVNLALALAEEGKKCCLVDLDIVNPYFRSADNEKQLKEAGVRPILPEFANTNVDIPSLPKEYGSVFVTDECAVIDVGGDGDGATALGVHSDKYESCGYSMYYVYNYYRPYISDPRAAAEMLREIEKASRMRFCGIINNSNLGAETTREDVEASFASCEELCRLTGLPLAAVTAFPENLPEGGVSIRDVTRKLF